MCRNLAKLTAMQCVVRSKAVLANKENNFMYFVYFLRLINFFKIEILLFLEGILYVLF